MQINTTILSEVAYQLQHGNPWWGMALCNRYLSQGHPLRQAIATRFIARIGNTRARSQLAKELIAGKGLDRSQALAIGARVPHIRRAIPTPRMRRGNARLAVRDYRNPCSATERLIGSWPRRQRAASKSTLETCHELRRERS
jgi:hypothetical protein